MKNTGPFIINIDDISLSSSEKSIIKHDLVGGIIIFSHNFQSKIQLQSLIAELKSIKPDLLISIDHEGGRVQRIKKDFTHLPSFESISNTSNISLAHDVAFCSGYISGYELSEVGIDINYSPVVDIYNDQNSKLLKDRTFGSDINKVITLSKKYIDGCLMAGVLPVLKHYPGHGRVHSDSHIANCVSNTEIEELMNTDIRPFRELANYYCDYQIPIMTNHVLYRMFDDNITTYSKKWLALKANEVFDKIPLFISDDLEMYSAKFYDNKEIKCEDRVLMALDAGCRLVIVTTMQHQKIIKEKMSYKYFSDNYLTNNIIKYCEKNHDKMYDINLSSNRLNKNRVEYDKCLSNLNTWNMQ